MKKYIHALTNSIILFICVFGFMITTSGVLYKVGTDYSSLFLAINDNIFKISGVILTLTVSAFFKP
jgi:hypothetical protein